MTTAGATAAAAAVHEAEAAPGIPASGPDLRLAWFVVGTWLAVLTAAPMPARRAVTLALMAAWSAVVIGIVVRGRSGWLGGAGLALIAALLGAASGAIATAAHTFVRDDATIRQLVAERASVRAELTLTSDPRLSHGSSPGRQTWVVPATLTRMTSGATAVRLDAPALVLGLGTGWPGLLPGQRVAVVGELAPPDERGMTLAVLVVEDPPELVGTPPWYQRLAGALRTGLQRACRGLPSSPGGLLPALVDGDTSRLDPRVQRDFLAAGMTYLVVVSGAHLAIALGGVLLLASWGRCGPRLRALIGMLAIVAFVVLARPVPSVIRAAAMATLGLIAAALGRPRAALPALLTGVYVLLIINPALALQVGFTLSTLATAGLLLLVPPWRARLCRHGVPPGLATAAAIPLAAQVACAPVIAAISGVVGVSAVPANILVEPAVAPATILGLVATLVSPVSPGAAHALAWLACWPCQWLVTVAHYAARAPAGLVPWPAGLQGGILLTFVLLACLALWARRPLLVAGPVGCLLAVLAIGGVSAVPQTGERVAIEPAPPSRSSQCQARRGPLPDPACTPGALNPDVTQDTIGTTICRAGWSATIRPPSTYTDALKHTQIEQYGYVDQDVGDYEEDHLVPLSLGGAPSDPRNLWPEPGASPNNKDQVEWDLQAAVCTRQISLADAQRAVASDWTTAKQRLGL